jgi:membrane protease YdiL (CAAX protease family)
VAALRRAVPRTRTALFLGGLAGAAILRNGVGTADNAGAAASTSAALVFVVAIAAVTFASGWRPQRVTWRAAAAGAVGAAWLVGAWLLARGGAGLHVAGDVPALAVWSPLVVLVAAAEEALFRGALFDAVEDWRGTSVALLFTSAAFALTHVPLYGWGALPIDAVVGLFLGGLRVWTGSVAAPAIAHALADLAGGWL